VSFLIAGSVGAAYKTLGKQRPPAARDDFVRGRLLLVLRLGVWGFCAKTVRYANAARCTGTERCTGAQVSSGTVPPTLVWARW
jgi:hypothetical protein